MSVEDYKRVYELLTCGEEPESYKLYVMMAALMPLDETKKMLEALK